MKKIIISASLVLGGALVFIFGSPYYKVFPTNGNQIYYIALVLFFLFLSLFLKRSKAYSIYWPAAYSLGIASTALLFLSTGILNLQKDSMNPVQFVAMDKLSQFLYVVPVIIIMTLLVKDDLKSLFIAKGKLKQGLIFGVISFLVMAAISLVPMLNSGNLFSFLLPSIHWILLFVFANAILEELWFRAIFLKKFEGLIGRNGAILVTSIVFGASHISATYDFPGGGLIFGIVVFGLGWLWAYLMFKYESLIVSILFHAGCDLLIIVPLLNSTEQMV